MMQSRPTMSEMIAKALLDKGLKLASSHHGEEAIAVYEDLLTRFGDATTELALRELVAKALLNKGATLGTLGRTGEAIAAYDDLLGRFGNGTEPSLRGLVSMGRSMKDRPRW